MTIDEMRLLACQLRDQVVSMRSSATKTHPTLGQYDDITALENIAESAGMSKSSSMLLAETITSYLDICSSSSLNVHLDDALTDQMVTMINWLISRQISIDDL